MKGLATHTVASDFGAENRTKNFDASDDLVSFVLCAVCERGLKGGEWYARLDAEDRKVALCCPLCLMAFARNPIVYSVPSAGMRSSKIRVKPEDSDPRTG